MKTFFQHIPFKDKYKPNVVSSLEKGIFNHCFPVLLISPFKGGM
jgi:hypothetical protein